MLGGEPSSEVILTLPVPPIATRVIGTVKGKASATNGGIVREIAERLVRRLKEIAT